MIRIVKFMDTEKSPVNIYDLQAASNACSSDTLEVIGMISYLSHFGQVEKVIDGWIIHSAQNYEDKKPYRLHYLEKMLEIIKDLLDQPKEIKSIKDKVDKIKDKEILSVLEFLELLTKYGYVLKINKRWELKQYQSQYPLIQ